MENEIKTDKMSSQTAQGKTNFKIILIFLGVWFFIMLIFFLKVTDLGQLFK